MPHLAAACGVETGLKLDGAGVVDDPSIDGPEKLELLPYDLRRR